MSKEAKTEYLHSIKSRYKLSSKNEKSIILDEFCNVCSYNRKYAIRLLNQKDRIQKHEPKPGRPRRYNHPEIYNFIKSLWIASNLVCSKRLKEMIPIWLPFSERILSDDNRSLLLNISPATIDRLLRKTRHKYKKIGLSTTKPGSIIKKHIPIRTNQWNEARPGFIEADTVAHCGTSVAGQFVYSVNITDIATGWTEARAVWGKGKTGVFKALVDIEYSLPFKLRGFDSDNGTEFISHLLLVYLKKRKINFTRSREYRKNDNAHIEQKNWTNIRQYLGYLRFDNPDILPLLNDLYTSDWSLFFNFFIPSFKLIDKKRDGSKTIKLHDKPKTPLQRLIDSKELKRKEIQHLLDIKNSLNPFLLQKSIKLKVAHILELVKHY